MIEHVDDPKRFAERAAELLAPGGLFVVATPNWDSADARRFKQYWGGNHFPRHWTLYDEKTIGGLADQVGLELERVEYQVNPVFWNWTVHSWLKGPVPESVVARRALPDDRDLPQVATELHPALALHGDRLRSSG